MNYYRIPRPDGMSVAQYLDYVTSLPWEFTGADRSIDGQVGQCVFGAYATLAGFDPAPPPVVVTLPVERAISKKDFLQLFTPFEYAGIKELRKTDAVVDWFMGVFEAAEYVNMNSPTVEAGLNYISTLPNTPLPAASVARILGG
ncbi:MAG: hypothetical protein ACOY4U_09235 [Pseudomonadota bacterium]